MADIYAPYAGDALSPEERQLYNLIMAYRAEHGLAAIPPSRALTTTAARHTLDLMENQGGYPSNVQGSGRALGWSDARFDNNDPSTYGALQNAPQRLGTGYSGQVHAMSVAYVGAWTPGMAPGEALENFKSGAGLNAVLLNLGTWAKVEWKAIGLSIHNGVAELWLGEKADLSGPPPGGPADVPSAWLGTEGADTQAGFATADAMRGLGGNDRLSGLGGDDRLEGGDGDDLLEGGVGNDLIEGGAGHDLAAFEGALGDHRLSQAGGWLLVEGPDGTDLLKGVEQLRFGLTAPVTVEALRASGTVRDLSFARTDTASGQAGQVAAAAYDGPVTRLALQFVSDDRGEAVNGSALSDFLNTQGGDDAINAGTGDDVLDGGLGSNFLTGGAGWDVFFSDGRGGGGTTWSTITDWEAGEQLSLWGWRPGVSRMSWVEGGGAEGFRGATLHADLDGDGRVDTSVTWSGLTQAALNKPFEMDGLLWFQ